jgi:hypothetical protein
MCTSLKRLPQPLIAAYGDPNWESWVLDEKTSIEHIRYAYERGINTFE